MEKGTIIITLDGTWDIEKCRRIIHTLFEAEIFETKNGKVILNFDYLGELAEIETQIKNWKKGKTIEIKHLEQFKVELTPVDKSSVAIRT